MSDATNMVMCLRDDLYEYDNMHAFSHEYYVLREYKDKNSVVYDHIISIKCALLKAL